jgi:regulator of protease activity HflC (stomatin/prohibitin superfamily)
MMRGWFGSDIFNLAFLPLIFVVISSAVSYILASLELKSAFEDEERILIEKRRENSALEVGEDVFFASRRSLENFRKYSPYVIAFLEFVISSVFLFLLYNYWQRRIELPVSDAPAQAAFVSGLLAVICLFSGVFATGQSREKIFRWFRVSGAWFLMAFAIFAGASAGILLRKAGYGQWDSGIRFCFFVLLAIVGAELFLNFVMEFYRPRGEKETRPVFESRFLAVFTEPGGIMRNIAETLDYQFGFKISGTWIYRFLENSIVPLVMLWLASLWLMTCVTEIYPNEAGIRESFGVREEGKLLSSGIHFKLPWPYGRIVRVPSKDIQELFVGMDEEEKEEQSDAILWTASHYHKEDNFLVASDNAVSENEAPVSYISSVFNIQYSIKESGILDYSYGNKDIRETIQSVTESVITKFLAGKDMLKMLSMERHSNKIEIKKKLQEAYDASGLGVEVVLVNILDVHPPVEKVAPSFQDVVGAMEEKEADILKAKAYENKVLPLAEAEKAKVIMDAETERRNVVKLAESENERFVKQLQAYRQMPAMFKLRAYLDFFENDCANVRKLVIDSSIGHKVFILNFEEKQRLDLLDISIGDIAPEKK